MQTRAEHYLEAEELLNNLGWAETTDEVNIRIARAQVHATLATAPPTVEEEAKTLTWIAGEQNP
jgi:hypothetical protein